MNAFKRFINDQSGATAIEYGLIAGLIALGIVTGVTAVGSSINTILWGDDGEFRRIFGME